MAVFKITESSVSLVKNDEDRWNGSFASLILECQENDMRIFNTINEGALLEEENGQKSIKSAKDIIAIIINGIKIFGQKLKQLYDNAIIKIKELYSNKISKFAKKFKDEFNPAEYDENKILNMDPTKIPPFYTDSVEDGIVTINIDSLMKSALSNNSKIPNNKLISDAFKSIEGEHRKGLNNYFGDQLITPSMFSKYISEYVKINYKDKSNNARTFDELKDYYYKTENIGRFVDRICNSLVSCSESIKIVNHSRKESFKQIDGIIKNAKSSDQSIERARTCLEYSSAYQTVIATIANCNIKFIIAEMKNDVKLLKLIKSACSTKDGKKEDNSKGEEDNIEDATNEAFSMIF